MSGRSPTGYRRVYLITGAQYFMERISIESEQDKAIEVLGDTLGTCWFKKRVGICTDYECPGCDTCAKFNGCYEYLDEFNKLAVEKAANEKFARLMLDEESVRERLFAEKHGKYAPYFLSVLKMWLAIMVPIFIIVWYVSMCAGCSSSPHPEVAARTSNDMAECKAANERLIAWVISESREKLRDVNGDGKVNCVDYSVVFKETWDRICWARKERCGFVVNKNPVSGWNHMFISIQNVYWPWDMVKVEPQANVNPYMNDKSSLYVERYWGDKYNPVYDKRHFSQYKWVLDKCAWEGKQEYYIQNGGTTR